MPQPAWEFWIDVGGTFTDCCARRPDGTLARHKLLSNGITKGAAAAGSSAEQIVDPLRGGDPPGFWDGCEFRLLDGQGQIVARSTVGQFDPATGGLQLQSPLLVLPAVGQSYELLAGDEAPVLAIRYLLGLPAGAPIPPVTIRLGTTRGTNALITRRGAKTALVTSRGFGDLLEIGYQNRPRLFELAIRKPPPLATAVVEINEQMTADGRVLRSPDPAIVREQLTGATIARH